MKDAKGHGSDAQGGAAHQAGVEAAIKPPSPWEGKSGEFVHTGFGNLAAQGFTPTSRAPGRDVTGAMRVGWKNAQNSGAPSTITPTGRGGLTLVGQGNKIPYGADHWMVHPNGDVHRYANKHFYKGG